MQISRNDLYMAITLLIAERSICSRGKVGVVAVKDKRIIASGYNGVLPGVEVNCNTDCDLNESCNKTIHAEANLIAFCAKHGISLADCTIYCSYHPCNNCAKLLKQAGVLKVFYFCEYPGNNFNHGLIIEKFIWDNIAGFTLIQKAK